MRSITKGKVNVRQADEPCAACRWRVSSWLPPCSSRKCCKSGTTAKSDRIPPSPRMKNIPLFRIGKSVYNPRSPRHHEGRLRDRHGTWCGLRWTLAASARCKPCRRKRGSVRRSRVVLAPRPWRLSTPPRGGVATVATKAVHRGEREVSRKAIARGKSGCLGCPCQIRVRFFLPIAHGDAGAVSARLSLRPLHGGSNELARLERKARCENESP